MNVHTYAAVKQTMSVLWLGNLRAHHLSSSGYCHGSGLCVALADRVCSTKKGCSKHTKIRSVISGSLMVLVSVAETKMKEA